MFSRSPASEPKSSLNDIRPLDTYRANGTDARATPPPINPQFGQPAAPMAGPAPAGPSVASGFSLGSIIGNDLTIVGQGLRIITKGTLQVDGKVEGDVVGTEVIIGEKGEVTGVVSGESVIIRGQVHGTIRGMKVALQSSARVEGDVHHQQLSVEQGAVLDGRVRRPKDTAELKPDLDPASRSAA